MHLCTSVCMQVFMYGMFPRFHLEIKTPFPQIMLMQYLQQW